MNRNRTTRKAFTLIEVLVVVIIIGILAALLLPAVNGAIRRARDARIALEVNGLGNAMEALKSRYGDYPPDFEEFDRNRVTRAWSWGEMQQTKTGRFLRKNFPKIGAADIAFLVQGAPAIDNSEALVLWLKGLSSNPKAPFTGPDGPGSFAVTGQFDDVFDFDFDLTRLGDRDGDGLQEYYPPFAPADGQPYCYFNSDTYSVRLPAGWYPSAPNPVNGQVFIHAEHDPKRLWQVTFDIAGGMPTYAPVAFTDADATSPIGIARPLKTSTAIPVANRNPVDTHRGADFFYADRDKFQIICGGQDGKFGMMMSFYPTGDPLPAPNGGKVYPNPSTTIHIGYGPTELDNITSFSEGSRLEDVVP